MAGQSNTQNFIIIGAIVAVGVMAGYFYYTGILQGQIPVVAPFKIEGVDNLAKFQNTKFNLSVLDNQQFKTLKTFGEAPVQPGVTGRTDIFAPF